METYIMKKSYQSDVANLKIGERLHDRVLAKEKWQ
jgi:hypothetical protein